MVTWAYAALLAWLVAMPAPVTSVAPVPSIAPVPSVTPVTPAAPVTPAVSPMPRPEQVMAVPPELRAQLQQQVIDAGGSGRARLERLVGFLFQKPGLGMEYSAGATLTIDQAYRTRKANCLTFTLLTVVLARESGLQAYGQELDDIVAWRVGDDVIYRFNHVNTGITIGHSRLTVDVARDLVMARDSPKPISDQRLLALYYSNRAAELLAGVSPAAAAPYMAMALQLAPRYASAWANAGVLHLRQGDPRAAERDYLKALALDPVNAGALVNLVVLYRSNGDEARRAIYARRLEKAQVKDPYFQFMQAEDDEKRGDYAGAVQHYRQAIRLYDGDSRFYVGLAHAYQQLGEERHAQRAMDRAAALGRSSAGGRN
ncbi:transglutaminase [Rhodanobacter sp. FW510-R12]|uniref:tetratricopeptide repeat protein n=1 Tax=unclassified Rhodanobacter TaxID=2621553 RepID=UPI0007A9EAC1|nr:MULTISPECIES: tetratricopeptide repeat protein [unclassified Rhodanobacter]KZC17978.1 transglutaminase [Rhodanobacter sp. FW104-R8]KZC25622.1 transglutaminase [Rhodanobacter sp. FW510-T8]KZC32854.1 transglutaminase [Rhodanobacter sp. FW510-R10]